MIAVDLLNLLNPYGGLAISVKLTFGVFSPYFYPTKAKIDELVP